MASPATGPALAERADIHKSCKSIETLLNILNEYCEAAGAVVALQKKLAKALRETAGLRVTGEIAANAMHASASIFEALSDIDSKFSKVADKEYDIVSAEVKKWFKKLAKEEKAHDERMANANAKIKQAGQAYEKKSKKKTIDASEEHAKYINLISTLGPEVSQEKYNHVLNVTQRHTTTTYSVAACLSRLADTEWQKSCECIRRFSPTIGPLGQWRSLCEGGWTGALPPDLPDLNISNGQPNPQIEREPMDLTPIGEEVRQPPQSQAATTGLTPEPRELIPPPGYSTGPPSASESSNEASRDQTSARNSPTLTRRPLPATVPTVSSEVASPSEPQSSNLEPPKAPFVDAKTGSVRSLSAFPTPPTHFPLPPPRQPYSQQSSYFQSVPSSSNLDFPSSTQLAESPISANDDHSGVSDLEESSSAPAQQSDIAGRRKTRHGPLSSTDLKLLNMKPYTPDEYEQDSREFGMINRDTEMSAKSRTVENSKYPRALERMDTGASSGSIVAAMRNRYSHNSGSTSPPPRELTRLPLSVNDLATRYQPVDVPLSPRARPGSPPILRQQSLPLLDTATTVRQAQGSYQERMTGQAGPNSDDDRRRPQRYENIAEQRAKEQELRERERELEMRARELERDRVRLQTLREDDRSDDHAVYREGSAAPSEANQFGLRPRERRTSLRHQLQRPLSQMELDVGPNVAATSSANVDIRQQSPYAYTSTHLSPPSTSGVHTPPSTTQPPRSPKLSQRPQPPSAQPQAESQYDPRNRDRYPDNNGYNSNTNSTNGSTHAAYCGCQTCSVDKYKNAETSSSGQQLQSRQQQQAPIDTKAQNQRLEKPSKLGGGWMRRLSMPVGNAFSSDSKRHQNSNSISSTTSNYGLGSGIGSNPASGSRGIFSLDGKRNASMTILSSSVTSNDRGLAVKEDGRLQQSGGMGRRSFEASGISNRSMTNLGITGRH